MKAAILSVAVISGLLGGKFLPKGMTHRKGEWKVKLVLKIAKVTQR